MGHRLPQRLDALRAKTAIVQTRWWLLTLPWLVLGAGLAVTHGLWQSARDDAVEVLEAEFEFAANKVVYAIEGRLNAHVQVLALPFVSGYSTTALVKKIRAVPSE